MLMRPSSRLLAAGCFVTSLLPSLGAAANDVVFQCASQPTYGKVCKLVCETKKLTAVCYACQCDEICIPGPSRQGCKHCATCYGEPRCDECSPPCSDCQPHAPKCEFCWRDWFACGCAKPRTVKVLTKYEAEQEIGWYHWEVVDAACCDCVPQAAATPKSRAIYKPAPADAELGDVMAVSKEEWAELAAALAPGEDGKSVQVADQKTPETTNLGAEQQRISIAERLQGLFRK